MKEIGLLGLPDRFEGPFRRSLATVGGEWRPNARARLKGLQGGIVALPPGEEPLTRAFDALCGLLLQDTSVRVWSNDALQRARYKADPRCVIPKCDVAPCARLCGVDQWSTPHYHRLAGAGRRTWEEDCDGIELAACAAGGGGPLFVLPERGKMGHVMHLASVDAAPVARAIDYCIPAGMKAWKGPRRCAGYLGGARREGTIENGAKPHEFTVYWKGR